MHYNYNYSLLLSLHRIMSLDEFYQINIHNLYNLLYCTFTPQLLMNQCHIFAFFIDYSRSKTISLFRDKELGKFKVHMKSVNLKHFYNI